VLGVEVKLVLGGETAEMAASTTPGTDFKAGYTVQAVDLR